jgi:hypothetical protein
VADAKGPLEDGYILLEVILVYAPEGSQEVSQACPETFQSVAMGFSNSIAILIVGPDPLAGNMGAGVMLALVLFQLGVAVPVIGVNASARRRISQHRFTKAFPF